MKFTNELKEFFRYTYGWTGHMSMAAQWLYNEYVDEAFKHPFDELLEGNWDCLFKSKEYKSIMDAAKWFDQRYDGGGAEKAFTQALDSIGVRE